ncbi:mannitol-1-phosphate 5-dehydrogenase [Escherichia coli]|nr:mannitol-1-phosphate 5-dehydrogenase [Escherichia coli]
MRRIRQPTPDATLARLIRPTTAVKCRPDKAFTPHPA